MGKWIILAIAVGLLIEICWQTHKTYRKLHPKQSELQRGYAMADRVLLGLHDSDVEALLNIKDSSIPSRDLLMRRRVRYLEIRLDEASAFGETTPFDIGCKARLTEHCRQYTNPIPETYT